MKTISVNTEYQTVRVSLEDLEYSLLAVRLGREPEGFMADYDIAEWLEQRLKTYPTVLLLTQPEETVKAEVIKAITAPQLLDSLRAVPSGGVTPECASMRGDPEHPSNRDAYVLARNGSWFTYSMPRVMNDLLATTLSEVPRTALAMERIRMGLQEAVNDLRGVEENRIAEVLDEQVLLMLSDLEVGHSYQMWRESVGTDLPDAGRLGQNPRQPLPLVD
ncbi:hypothetical protein QWY84_18590 [Aquisalimonas lutea]|uniref:hypothetical protein n=1 Tax=Aquisalimonas lutea TaxID=1327750 RepID=UPI0025B34E8A|nr:hypothetical protein [Aquisalimonas lutea]MDN3519620.1 hypothetical protein [Aquisalimonas lutea]